MTAHPARGGAMPGAAALSALEDLSPREAGAIVGLRAWCEGPEGQAWVWQCYAHHHGPIRGRTALRNFEALVRMVSQYARRPMARHAVQCRCAGADECWFARLVGLAADNAREDALMLAMTFLRPDIALQAVDLAQQAGLRLPPMKLPGSAPQGPAPSAKPARQRLH